MSSSGWRFCCSNFYLMLDEMQRKEVRLSEKIDGRCSGLEQRDVEHRLEERPISLEMSRTEAAIECVEMDKQLRGLKLEVKRINKFLERESMANSHSKPGILATELTSAPHPSSTIVDGPDGHRVANHHQYSESGLFDTHPHILVNGTN
jgi:hypothetical protein